MPLQCFIFRCSNTPDNKIKNANFWWIFLSVNAQNGSLQLKQRILETLQVRRFCSKSLFSWKKDVLYSVDKKCWYWSDSLTIHIDRRQSRTKLLERKHFAYLKIIILMNPLTLFFLFILPNRINVDNGVTIMWKDNRTVFPAVSVFPTRWRSVWSRHFEAIS